MSAAVGHGTFRQCMSWLHTWAGLVLGWLLYFIFLTGTLGYFDTEIDRWMQPELPRVDKTLSQRQLLIMAEQHLEQVAPDTSRWIVNLPSDRLQFLLVEWRGKSGWQDATLNHRVGEPVSVRETGGGQTLYAMHYALHYMPVVWAYWLTSLAALFMLVALITGIVIHKKIFKEFFTFRPGEKRRSWLDIHNLMSVLPLPFHLMITYSGLVFLMFTTMPGVISATYGLGQGNKDRFFEEAFADTFHPVAADIAAETISLHAVLADVEKRWGENQVAVIDAGNRGDINARIKITRNGYNGLAKGSTLTYDGVTGQLLHSSEDQALGSAAQLRELLINLHEGQFAGVTLRWLYFLSGLLGTGMVATGMILWAVKRQKKAAKNVVTARGLLLVERLNVGAIVGLPIAIAVYFWANRLLPIGMPGRADWEVNMLFITLALCLFFPVFRPVSRAWVEMLFGVALLYGLLPFANMLLTERHLGVSLLQGDWVMAGVDLALLGTGLVFALAALKMQQRDRVFYARPNVVVDDCRAALE